jgi:hypothetical protein
LVFAGLLSLGVSCGAYKKPPEFPVYGPDGSRVVLYGLSKDASAGVIPPLSPKPLEYLFAAPLSLPPLFSLEVEYGLNPGDLSAAGLEEWKNRCRIVLRLSGEALGEALGEAAAEAPGEAPWELPGDASFLGAGEAPEKITYAVPLTGPGIEKISFTVEDRESSGPPPRGEKGPAVTIRSLRFLPRWFGFVREGGASYPVLRATPFVSGETGTGGLGHAGPVRLVIDPPPPYRIPGALEVSLSGPPPGTAITAGPLRYEYSGGGESILIPAGALPREPYPLVVSGPGPSAALRLTQAPERPFPLEPVPADPGIILAYDQSQWRNPRYEVFRWEHFPSVLIFDTADYAVQDRLFKRLAFFVEKKGYAGRLMGDAALADLHGWNAHDYRAEDLAAFFAAARARNFPLTEEEEELETILRHTGVLKGAGAGAGAVLSISRESSEYLRGLFMIHEGFHGLFFIDRDFQEFCRLRWEGLDPAARRFIRAYFDYQGYDGDDSFLVINEFMAHCLQQPVSRAAWYFGEVLAGRLNEHSWRRTSLPPMDEASGAWPDLGQAFTRETGALSSYVNQRWGFTAGRIRRLTP